MIIIGPDYHPGFQQIALVDMETGSLVKWRCYANNPFAPEFTIYLQSRDNGTLARFYV
jgi:hypothetical protein